MRHLVPFLLLALPAWGQDAGSLAGPEVYRQADRVTYEVLVDARWDDRAWDWRYANSGTGVGFDAAGWIVTNAHVIQTASSLTVITPAGHAVQAEDWIWSTKMDLGLIRVPGLEVHPAEFGDSDALEVGVPVYAFGRPLQSRTLSAGIVSALHRSPTLGGRTTKPIQDYLQIDVPVNPGNSGGGLFDGEGRVVGIVAESFVRQGNDGMSFALPATTAAAVARQLIERGTEFRHAKIQAAYRNTRGMPQGVYDHWGVEELRGVLVRSYTKDVPSTAGLELGDQVLAVDGIPIESWTHLEALVARHQAGETVRLSLARKGQPLELELTTDGW